MNKIVITVAAITTAIVSMGIAFFMKKKDTPHPIQMAARQTH